jgi:hypothetical protein
MCIVCEVKFNKICINYSEFTRFVLVYEKELHRFCTSKGDAEIFL